MNQIPFISERQVLRSLSANESNRWVETCFKHLDDHHVQMPSKIYLNLPKGDFRAMPVYTRLRGGIAGIKWICVFPENFRYHLSSVIGLILLNDANTGKPLALVEANALTAFRTGSVGAVASHYLATKRKNIVFTLVGAGVQAEYQLRCHIVKFDIKKINVWAPDIRESLAFAKRLKKLSRRIVAVRDLEEAVKTSDIISTCTPSREPLIHSAWVRKGTHINAIGADAPGKQELSSDLLKRSKIYIDHWEQALHSGEVNVPFSKGKIHKRNIIGTLTDVIRKKVKRTSVSDISVFDSTGLAIHDIVLADYVYKKTRSKKNL